MCFTNNLCICTCLLKNFFPTLCREQIRNPWYSMQVRLQGAASEYRSWDCMAWSIRLTHRQLTVLQIRLKHNRQTLAADQFTQCQRVVAVEWIRTKWVLASSKMLQRTKSNFFWRMKRISLKHGFSLGPRPDARPSHGTVCQSACLSVCMSVPIYFFHDEWWMMDRGITIGKCSCESNGHAPKLFH